MFRTTEARPAAAVRADMAPYIARKLAEAQARNRFVKIAA